MIQLPDTSTTRWTPKKKGAVCNAVRMGELNEADACAMYDITAEELGYWMHADELGGTPALRVTRIQHYALAFAN